MKLFSLLFIIVGFLNVSAQVFVKNLGNPGIDDGTTCLQIHNNTIYVSGYSGKDSYLAALNLDGDLLWKKYFSFSEYANYISDFLLHDNHLYICGYGHDSGTAIFDDFFVKYSLSLDKIVWAKRTSLQIKPNNIHLDNGNLLITGDEYAKGKFALCFLKLSEKNGKVETFNSWYFSGQESAAIAKIEGETLFVGGRYALKAKTDKYRAAVSQFTLNDLNHLNTHYFLNSKQDNARAYLADFEIKGDTVIGACFSNNMGIDNQYSLSLFSTLKNGSVNWAQEYHLDGYTSISVKDFLALEDGFLLLGQAKLPQEDLFLSKFDWEGYPMTTVILGSNLPDNIRIDQGKFLLEDKGFIYLSAQSKNVSNMGDYDSFILKIGVNDTWDSNCFPNKIGNLQMKAYEELIEGSMTLLAYDTSFKEMNVPFQTFQSKVDYNKFLCKPIEPIQEKNSAFISFENVAFNNTVYLLDASLSMNREDRMPLLKKSIFKILGFMRTEDKISVISYANKANLILNGLSASENEQIEESLNSLLIGGQSDIVAGLQMSLKIAKENASTAFNNRIIISTDGDLSLEKLAELKSVLLKNQSSNIIVSFFLFNNSSVYLQQLQDLAQSVGASVHVIDKNNIENVLLNELRAKKM